MSIGLEGFKMYPCKTPCGDIDCLNSCIHSKKGIKKMKKYQFIQAVYHYYEIEAESEEQAYEKTSDTTAEDCYDTVIGEWTNATQED
jgi:hypothetical protein